MTLQFISELGHVVLITSGIRRVSEDTTLAFRWKKILVVLFFIKNNCVIVFFFFYVFLGRKHVCVHAKLRHKKGKCTLFILSTIEFWRKINTLPSLFCCIGRVIPIFPQKMYWSNTSEVDIKVLLHSPTQKVLKQTVDQKASLIRNY